MSATSVGAQGVAEAIAIIPLGAQDAPGLFRLHLQILEKGWRGLEGKHGRRHTDSIRFFFSWSRVQTLELNTWVRISDENYGFESQ